MAATSIFRCLPSFSGVPHPRPSAHSHYLLHHHHPHQLPVLRSQPTAQFSRRTEDSPQESDGLLNEGFKWGRIEFMGNGEDDYEDDEEEEDDRSLELLVKFVENVFKKVSRRARKAVRSVLPPAISTKLVGFTVNGAIILAFLWVLKAFLEVIHYHPHLFMRLHQLKF
ncbi:hypothetical protein Dimus_003061 [Dionaea muscipula]